MVFYNQYGENISYIYKQWIDKIEKERKGKHEEKTSKENNNI